MLPERVRNRAENLASHDIENTETNAKSIVNLPAAGTRGSFELLRDQKGIRNYQLNGEGRYKARTVNYFVDNDSVKFWVDPKEDNYDETYTPKNLAAVLRARIIATDSSHKGKFTFKSNSEEGHCKLQVRTPSLTPLLGTFFDAIISYVDGNGMDWSSLHYNPDTESFSYNFDATEQEVHSLCEKAMIPERMKNSHQHSEFKFRKNIQHRTIRILHNPLYEGPKRTIVEFAQLKARLLNPKDPFCTQDIKKLIEREINSEPLQIEELYRVYAEENKISYVVYYKRFFNRIEISTPNIALISLYDSLKRKLKRGAGEKFDEIMSEILVSSDVHANAIFIYSISGEKNYTLTDAIRFIAIGSQDPQDNLSDFGAEDRNENELPRDENIINISKPQVIIKKKQPTINSKPVHDKEKSKNGKEEVTSEEELLTSSHKRKSTDSGEGRDHYSNSQSSKTFRISEYDELYNDIAIFPITYQLENYSSELLHTIYPVEASSSEKSVHYYPYTIDLCSTANNNGSKYIPEIFSPINLIQDSSPITSQTGGQDLQVIGTNDVVFDVEVLAVNDRINQMNSEYLEVPIEILLQSFSTDEVYKPYSNEIATERVNDIDYSYDLNIPSPNSQQINRIVTDETNKVLSDVSLVGPSQSEIFSIEENEAVSALTEQRSFTINLQPQKQPTSYQCQLDNGNKINILQQGYFDLVIDILENNNKKRTTREVQYEIHFPFVFFSIDMSNYKIVSFKAAIAKRLRTSSSEGTAKFKTIEQEKKISMQAKNSNVNDLLKGLYSIFKEQVVRAKPLSSFFSSMALNNNNSIPNSISSIGKEFNNIEHKEQHSDLRFFSSSRFSTSEDTNASPVNSDIPLASHHGF